MRGGSNLTVKDPNLETYVVVSEREDRVCDGGSGGEMEGAVQR